MRPGKRLKRAAIYYLAVAMIAALNLVSRNTILCLDWIPDYGIPVPFGARVIAETDSFRHRWHLVNQVEIVKIEDTASISSGQVEFFPGGVVRCKHQAISGATSSS